MQKKNLGKFYGQKQEGHVWHEYVVLKLIQIEFFWDDIIFILYVDDGVFMANHNHLMNKAI